MKNQNEILQELLAYAKELAPNFSWVAKTPQSDILSATSPQFWALYFLIFEYVRSVSNFSAFSSITDSLKNNLKAILDLTDDELDSLLKSDLDNLASLWDYTRNSAQSAYGNFRFVFNAADVVSISEGLNIRSQNGITYQTSQAVTNAPNDKGDGYYSVDVYCESLEEGVQGNVAAETYFDLVNATLTNFEFAFPVNDIDNGVDEETNDDFITRIDSTRSQRGVGSLTWLENYLLMDPRVYDVNIQRLGDDYFYRSYGTDVWIYGEEDPVSRTEDFITENIGGDCGHILQKAPLIAVDPIESYPNGVNIFTLVRGDEEGYYNGYSIKALNHVLWNGNCGVNGGSITYYYDSTITDLQEILDTPSYWMMNSRDVVLLKKAFPKYLEIRVRIKIDTAYTFDIVRSNVRQDLFAFIYGGRTSNSVVYSKQTFVTEIQKSDILEVILDSVGVDQVNLSLFKVKKVDADVWAGETISFDFNEYPAVNVTNTDQVSILEMV